VADPTRLIVSGGLRPDNVAEAVPSAPGRRRRVLGVESSPGRKDPLKAARLHRQRPRRRDEVLAARDPLADTTDDEPYDWRDA
jgi:hypothetical protein